ncbi:M15 family metallopeptidase [Brumimicrobium oceani]|uniref:D-alanyl-D-alanine dipeptidase n=1 Tax=Brumimicrobium oceani TaxID=2100725 RepID=A0A2U2XF01_9FLAO|nr:M15 family metallopeptidase [Brumimicrobium oceani]PWH86382.1 peptidase M15 [Brumimicrobium oceani]
MKRITYLFPILLFTSACSNPNSDSVEKLPVKSDSIVLNEDTLENLDVEELNNRGGDELEVMSELEQKMIDAGLVDIQSVDSTIQVDVKYATMDNFMNRILYAGYDKVYLQPVVAERLSKAQKALKNIDSTLTLIAFDGTRPRSVQQEMWDALDTIPFNERVKFVSNPVNGSIHNYGSAVDLSILDLKTGLWLDMGAGYDDLRKIAYPRHEEKFLASGELTLDQVNNRKLLRKVMSAGGFWVIETEWWHFNAFSRKKAKELFEVVE